MGILGGLFREFLIFFNCVRNSSVFCGELIVFCNWSKIFFSLWREFLECGGLISTGWQRRKDLNPLHQCALDKEGFERQIFHHPPQGGPPFENF